MLDELTDHDISNKTERFQTYKRTVGKFDLNC